MDFKKNNNINIFSLKYFLILTILISPTSFAKPEKEIFGRIENILIEPEHIEVNAKMDTGAYRSAIHARNIELYEKDGKKWIKFILDHSGHERVLHKPFIRYIMVKERITNNKENNPRAEKRPVVLIDICMGDKKVQLEASLTNRTNFINPILIGRQAMKRNDIIIDSSLIHTSSPKCKIETQEILN